MTKSPLLRHPLEFLFAVLAVAGIAVAWMLQPWGTAPRTPATSAAAPADSPGATAPTNAATDGNAGPHPAMAQQPAGTIAAPATRTSTSIVRGAPSATRDAYERAGNLGALFNALHVQSGADALFFAQRALRDCQPYLMAVTQPGEPPALDRYRPAPPDHPLTARRQVAYAALQARCSGFDLGADPAATAKALREALLASNEPRAALDQAANAVRRGGAPADAMNSVRAAASDGDPYALEQASAVMSALRGRYVFLLDGQVVKPDIVAAGWMMAACDAGRSCGYEWVQAPCAFLTECDARDLESSLQRYQLTPQEFDAMQQVRTRVMRGVAGGQWDPALFAPQPAPPGYRRWGP